MRAHLYYTLLMAGLMTANASANVTSKDFGQTRYGKAVTLFTIANSSGASLQVMTYGATMVSLNVPDRDGKIGNVILGYDTLSGYESGNAFFGATAGRYANRIAGAAFTLEGVAYKLQANERGNTLHSGRTGFNKVLWSAEKIDDQTVEFTYVSPDGEGGFPGNLTAHVRYSFDDHNALAIIFTASTDKTTVVNIANHSYFNLAGSGDVVSQELMIDAGQFTPVDAGLIPTGKLQRVEGTPFDFRTLHPIGQYLHDDDAQLRFGGGYDHNFVLNSIQKSRSPKVTLYDPASGRVMNLYTDQPGVQFYSGNGLGRSIVSRTGPCVKYGAVCLEPQHFPDSPHQPDFPSTVLKPGETYTSQTAYQFSTRAAATTAP